MNKKRIMTVLLAASMLVSTIAVTSCKKDTGPVKSRRTNVYGQTELSAPEEIDWVNNMVYIDDMLYMLYNKEIEIKHYNDGTEEELPAGMEPSDNAVAETEIVEEEPEVVEAVEEVSATTSVAPAVEVEVEEPEYYTEYQSQTWVYGTDLTGENTLNYQIMVADEIDSGYMSNLTTSAGKLYMMYETWGETNGYIMFVVDPKDGTVETKYDLTSLKSELGLTEEDYFYIDGMCLMDTTMYLYAEGSESAFMAYDLANNKIVKKFELPENVNWINNMYATDTGVYYSTYMDGKGYVLFSLDLTTGESTENEVTGVDYFNVIGSNNGKLYFQSSDGIIAWDSATGTSSEVLNYINCDVNNNDVNTVVAIPDGRFVYSSSDWDSDTQVTTFSLVVLERIPDEEMQEEVLLTIASADSDYNLRNVVIDFNKQNTGVRLNIKTYEEYNNEENEWKGAYTQLNADITMGNVPDILVLDSELPVESYYSKGVLVDLYPYMDDPENGIDRSQYLENILGACEQNGKLYSLITAFSLRVLSAKEEFVGSEPGWTMAEMLDVIESMPEDMWIFPDYGRDELLDMLLSLCGESFVDWENGTTNFESEDFIRLVTFLKDYPEKSVQEAYYETVDYDNYDYEAEEEWYNNYQMRYFKNFALFLGSNIYQLNGYTNVYRNFAGDATLIGYPTTDGGNGAVIDPILELGICTSSVNKDSAWVFLKYLLTSEDYFNDVYGFTLSKKWLDKSLDESEETYNSWYYEYSEEELEQMREYYSDEYVDWMRNRQVSYNKEMGQRIYDLVVNATTVVRTNEDLMNIIKEELSSFFGGGKTAEEAARIIDSRARVYVAENS